MSLHDWLAPTMAVGGYLLGSIPFGIVASRCLGTVDPRTAGSRNIGFTNVLRVSGRKAGAFTLAGDLGKGWLVAWTGQQVFEGSLWTLLIAASAIIGHMYPVFLGFRGGKGVATALGAVTGIAPWIGMGIVMVWLGTAAIWRYSSAAAIMAFALFPLMSLAVGAEWRFQIFSVLISGLVLLRHRDNFRRLWHGTELKMGRSRKQTA